jgi:hypothetical protein
MSDGMEGRPWGLCAAYGCPLLGSIGSDGRWYCFCHVHKPSTLNDAISQELRGELMPIVQSTLDIRAHHSSFHDAPNAYRMIQERLTRAGRKDLLLGNADCSPHRPGQPMVKAWLMRLERVLIDATNELGKPKPLATTVPTKPVIGPTHAANFHSYSNAE